MDRHWLRKITLDWKNIGLLTINNSKVGLNKLLEKYGEVFKKDTFTANLHLKPNFQPKFVKARPVPFAIKPAVDRELDRLEQEGIIIKVTHSEWPSPVVVVSKPRGRLSLCGDYKVTNSLAVSLTKARGPFCILKGGQSLTKIDLTHAYQQMSLKKECQKLVVINTHHGLYQYTTYPLEWSHLLPFFKR